MGLDLRNFHDAVTFKIMIMLMDRYMQECLILIKMTKVTKAYGNLKAIKDVRSDNK